MSGGHPGVLRVSRKPRVHIPLPGCNPISSMDPGNPDHTRKEMSDMDKGSGVDPTEYRARNGRVMGLIKVLSQMNPLWVPVRCGRC